MFVHTFEKAAAPVLQVFKNQPLGSRVLIELNSPVQKKAALEIMNETLLRFGYLPVEVKLTSKRPLDRQLDEVVKRNPDHKLVFQFVAMEQLYSEFSSERDASEFLEKTVAVFHIQKFPFIFWASTYIYDSLYQYGPSVLKAAWEHIRVQAEINLPLAMLHQLHPPTPEKVRTHTISILENQLQEQKLVSVGGYQYINVLQTLARNYFDHEQYEKAFECYEQCIRSGQTNIYTVAEYRNQMGLIYLIWGRFDKSQEMLSESLRIRKELDDKKGLAISWLTIGNLHQITGRFNRALDAYRQSSLLTIELDEWEIQAFALLNTGIVYQMMGNSGAAFESYKKALDLFKKIQFNQGIALALVHIAFFQATNQKVADALKYYLLSRSLAEKHNLVHLIEAIDRHLEILKAKLGEQEYIKLGNSIRQSIAQREKEDQKLTSF